MRDGDVEWCVEVIVAADAAGGFVAVGNEVFLLLICAGQAISHREKERGGKGSSG